MTIQQCLKNQGWNLDYNEIPECYHKAIVDIDFINRDGKLDCTEFDTSDFQTVGGQNKLISLWEGFCKDEKVFKNSVTALTVVGFE